MDTDYNGENCNDDHSPDSKGRLHPHIMSDREMLEELTRRSRQTEDLVLAFIESMKTNPMMKMFGPKTGK